MSFKLPKILSIACLLVLAVFGQPVLAAYKCISPDGAIEYVDLAKQGFTCSVVRAIPAPSPKKAEDDKEEQEAKTEEKEDSQAALRTENCKVSQDNLAVLEGESEVEITDEEGNKTVLNAEQRAAKLAQIKKDVDYWCDPAKSDKAE